MMTCLVGIKKYYDYENNKYILDKCEKIVPLSYDDIIDSGSYPFNYHTNHRLIGEWSSNGRQIVDDVSPIHKIPKFVPKDDDWGREEAEREKKDAEYRIFLAAREKEIMENRQKLEAEQRARDSRTYTRIMRNKWIVKTL